LCFTEAVKEGKADNDHMHTNGSAASTPTLPYHCADGALHNSITGMCDGDAVVQTPIPMDNTISLSPEYHPRPASTSVPVSHHGAEQTIYGMHDKTFVDASSLSNLNY
jgi:hypothetical protein